MIPTQKECKLLLQMWRDEGYTYQMIADNIEVTKNTVIRWCNRKDPKISVRKRVIFGKYKAEMERAKNQIIPLII